MKDILKMLSGGDFQAGVYENGGYFDGAIPKTSTYMTNFAMGGSLEAHGIKEGDTFMKTISGTIQKVKDKNGKIVYVDLSNGYRNSQPPLPFKNGGALIGNQKRIDMNKNGKIDAEDFKLLRSSMNGAWRNERKHVNHNEDYEVRYARKKPSRTGYKGKRNFEGGGDLFENYKEQPAELSKIVNFYMNKFDDGDYNYEDSKNFLKEVEAIGYTFDYGLDNEPYDLRPLRKMATGGGVSKSMQSKKMFFGGGLKKISTLKKYENFEGKIVITKDEKVFKVISQDKDMVEVINPNLLGTGVRPTSMNISEINKIV